MSIGRIIAATLFTLVSMPCMGFFIFGFMASYEFGFSERWPWQVGYAVLEVIAIGAVIAAWWFALRRVRQPGECATCGFALRGNTSGRCPECGA